MRPKPAAAELLEIARKTLRGDLLAALPEALRYQALMAANAIAIVGAPTRYVPSPSVPSTAQ